MSNLSNSRQNYSTQNKKLFSWSLENEMINFGKTMFTKIHTLQRDYQWKLFFLDELYFFLISF